jgi:hypothetical protein
MAKSFMTSPIRRWSLLFLEYGLVLAGLTALAFFLFWQARIDWPTNDQIPYMAERDMVHSDWSWFWHSVSYSRARFTLVGDYFAFRPAHLTVLVTEDFLARENLEATGALSLCFLALTGFSLYLAVKHFAGRLLAVPFSLLFIAELAGSRIVMWRHISPYLFSLTFFGLGVFLLSSSPEKKWAGRMRWASVVFFIAALFHEFVVLTLILAVPVLILRAFFQKDSPSRAETKLMALVLGLPAAAYLFLNIIDFVVYRPPSFLGPSDLALPSAFARYAEPVLRMVASFAVALFVPPSAANFDYWAFVDSYPMLSLTLGMVLIALCYRVFRNSFKEWMHGKNMSIGAAGIAVTLSLACLALGTGIGRGTLRGVEYIRDARQYSAMAIYITLLILSIFIHQLRHMKSRFVVVSRFVISLIVGILAISNAVQLRKTVPALYAGRAAAADRFLVGLQEIKTRRLCVAGYDPLAFNSTMPEYLLLRNYRCDGSNGVPIYLAAGDKGLILTQIPEARTEALPTAAFTTPDGWAVSGLPDVPRWTAHGPTAAMVLTTAPVSDAAIQVHAHSDSQQSFNGGLVVGLQDPANYFQFFVESDDKVVEQQVVNGTATVRREERLPPGLIVDKLETRCAGGNLYFFVNDFLLLGEPNLCPSGKVGVFTASQARIEFFNPRRTISDAPSILIPLNGP